MEQNIKEWIQLARRISRRLLNQPEGEGLNEQEREELKIKSFDQRLLRRLSDPSYYARRITRMQEINEKYTYEKFVAEHQQKIRRRRLQVLRYAASALLLLSLGVAGWFYQHSTVSPAAGPFAYFSPGNTKASLVLGNGKEVTLDAQLTLTEQDGTVIQNDKEGEVSYQTATNHDSTLHYNTLRVPRGGEYRITLADGTRVWVNSESELMFPTRFSAAKREVFLKGEAYFEIAHNKEKPFYVKSGAIQVHATGTAFNVMAYADEPDLRVTLVEGGVNIEDNQQVISRLTPSSQFVLNRTNGEYDIRSIDPRVATSWKNGNFFFDDEPLGSIIRKLSRWYAIDIECNNPEISQYKFSGEIRKYENADKVLDMLKLTNEITYTIRQDQKILIHSTE